MKERDGGTMYWRFLATIGTSTAAMFGLMYLNTYAWEHVVFSETRFWMAFVMGACMAVIMPADRWTGDGGADSEIEWGER